MKILLAGILGAVAMFIWTSIAHMALPLGEAGISEIPNEQAVLAAMQSSIGEKSGLYFFPGLGVGPNATRQEKNEAMKQEAAKMASGPSGLLIYNYARPFAFAKALTIEFATELVEAISLCSSSPRQPSRVSPAESASSWLPEFSPPLPPTFLIGIGMAFPAFTPSATCLPRLSAFCALVLSPHWYCESAVPLPEAFVA
jgi:hypothetical protein